MLRRIPLVGLVVAAGLAVTALMTQALDTRAIAQNAGGKSTASQKKSSGIQATTKPAENIATKPKKDTQPKAAIKKTAPQGLANSKVAKKRPGKPQGRTTGSMPLIRSLFRQWLFADESYGPRDNTMTPRDPFTTTPRMRDAAQLSGPQFVPSSSTTGVPKLSLKGLLESKDGDPVGLLMVDGFGTFMVVEGEQISLQSGNSNLVLLVKSISPNTISVEVGTLGQLIMVR